MKALLLDYSRPEERYDWSTIEKTYNIEVLSIPPSFENTDSIDDRFHDFVIEKIAIKEVGLIFIPVSVTNTYLSHTGLRLGMHLRLTDADQSGGLRYVPIVFMGFESELQFFKNSQYASFLLTPKVFYIFHSVKSVKNFIDNKVNIPFVRPEEFQPSLQFYPIHPEPNLESNHSLANEWGAFELDRFTVKCLKGKTNNLDKNIYIKWLECQFNEGRKSDESDEYKLSPIAKGKKILYIDDEWNKNWNEVLECIFTQAGCEEFKCIKELKKGLSRIKTIEIAIEEIKNKDWDLILLDLRLTEDDHDDNCPKFTGEEILEFIKGNNVQQGYNPLLPVIIFTASTKANNNKNLVEKGVDGYYTKHGPSDSRTPEKVKVSVKLFLFTIGVCLEKGALLQPYWKRIVEISKNNIIKLNERAYANGGQTKFEERVTERLIMFIGLLKKAYEQNSFDRNTFFYDQNETAFLTLWSTFNEISESYYRKNFGFENPQGSGTILKNHPNGDIIIRDWTIGGQQDKFLWREGIYDSSNQLLIENDEYKYETKSIFKYNRDQHIFTMTVISNKRESYEIKLFLQIAFLIKKQVNLRVGIENYCRQKYISPFFSQNEVQFSNYIRNVAYPAVEVKILNDLIAINAIRNHLYLTHGENTESIIYSQTIKESRTTLGSNHQETWKIEIERLFKLTYFLLKGKLIESI